MSVVTCDVCYYCGLSNYADDLRTHRTYFSDAVQATVAGWASCGRRRGLVDGLEELEELGRLGHLDAQPSLCALRLELEPRACRPGHERERNVRRA